MKTFKHTLSKMATVVLISSFLAVGCSDDSVTNPPTSEPDPIELSALVSPTPFKAEDKWHLVYEIAVRNLGQEPIEIEQVEVLDGSQRIAMYQGSDLTDLMFTPIIDGGQRGPIYLWITVTENSIPTTLRHNIKFAGASVPESHDVAVDASSPVALGPPLRGENWLALNISNSSDHRRSAFPFNGSLHIPERLAIDWLKLGPDFESFSGDPLVNSSYHAYGAELLAVHDGVIVAVKDGISENIPGQVPPPNPETAAGNWILLDMGNNQFALYAHLIPGSLRVQPGQTVRKGDVLGLLGNSGNSSEPHLHFHVAEVFDINNSPTLNAEGLPYIFESFEIQVNLQGNRPVLGQRMLELPLDFAVIRFPN